MRTCFRVGGGESGACRGSSTRARGLSARGRVAQVARASRLLLGPILLFAGCQVPHPSPEQVRNYGLGDPRRAFESLVTALQAELLDEEYNCLSRAFRDRNGLSQQTYRAFRDEFLAEYPRLRWALARARVEEVTRLDARLALVRARVPIPFVEDPVLTLTFVRETFWEIDHDGRPLGGDQGAIDPVAEGRLLLDEREPGRPRLWARFDLPWALTPEDLERDFAIAQGTEWRLDDFRLDR